MSTTKKTEPNEHTGAPPLEILDAEKWAGPIDAPDPKVVEEEIQREISENHQLFFKEPCWKKIQEEAEQLRREAYVQEFGIQID